ncbi:MAG: ABC transporter permease [Alphaproteobacteria bacterium]|nr:ABC transporter permease [Alphaproteobacteria bacterium]
MRAGQQSRLRLATLIAPGTLLVAAFFGCLGVLFVQSFLPSAGMGRLGDGFTLASYAAFLGDPFYVGYLLRSIAIAVYTTAIVLVLGYVVAYHMTLCGRRMRLAISIVLLVQFFTSFVIRTYAVMLVLGRFGIANRTLQAIGLTDEPLRLLFNEFAVATGIVLTAVPYMVFPIYGSLMAIEPNLRAAAESLGATRRRIFWEVVFPLSLPGVAAAVVIVFLFALTSYIAPGLLGGGYFDMIANLIYDKAVNAQDYPFAAAAAVVSVATTLVLVYLMQKGFRLAIRGTER